MHAWFTYCVSGDLSLLTESVRAGVQSLQPISLQCQINVNVNTLNAYLPRRSLRRHRRRCRRCGSHSHTQARNLIAHYSANGFRFGEVSWQRRRARTTRHDTTTCARDEHLTQQKPTKPGAGSVSGLGGGGGRGTMRCRHANPPTHTQQTHSRHTRNLNACGWVDSRS